MVALVVDQAPLKKTAFQELRGGSHARDAKIARAAFEWTRVELDNSSYSTTVAVSDESPGVPLLAKPLPQN
jgi:hypothetical protein